MCGCAGSTAQHSAADWDWGKTTAWGCPQPAMSVGPGEIDGE